MAFAAKKKHYKGFINQSTVLAFTAVVLIKDEPVKHINYYGKKISINVCGIAEYMNNICPAAWYHINRKCFKKEVTWKETQPCENQI